MHGLPIYALSILRPLFQSSILFMRFTVSIMSYILFNLQSPFSLPTTRLTMANIQ